MPGIKPTRKVREKSREKGEKTKISCEITQAVGSGRRHISREGLGLGAPNSVVPEMDERYRVQQPLLPLLSIAASRAQYSPTQQWGPSTSVSFALCYMVCVRDASKKSGKDCMALCTGAHLVQRVHAIV